MRQSIQSLLTAVAKLGFVGEDSWVGTRRRTALTALMLLVFAGGVFFGILMLAATHAPASWQNHNSIKGKRQGQFVSPGDSKKPATERAPATTPRK